MTGVPALPSMAAPTDGLAHTAEQRLFSDSPDGVALEGDLAARLGIRACRGAAAHPTASSGEANAALFPPVDQAGN